jgi:hypothetical protein
MSTPVGRHLPRQTHVLDAFTGARKENDGKIFTPYASKSFLEGIECKLGRDGLTNPFNDRHRMMVIKLTGGTLIGHRTPPFVSG